MCVAYTSNAAAAADVVEEIPVEGNNGEEVAAEQVESEADEAASDPISGEEE